MTAVVPMGRAVPAAPRSAPSDDAFEVLYERYSDRVFGYCLKWLRCREEAEDAVQSTFLYAMRGLRRGVVPRLDEAWLLAIARNVCLTRTEATRRRSVEVARDPLVLAESVTAPTCDDDLSGLSEALTGLTEAQRRAILLREWQGLSYQEIATALDLSQAAVETLLFRARRALAARLRGAGAFLPWLKSFAGGGAGSLAVGATLLTVTAAGTIATVRPHQPAAPATRPATHAVVETAVRTAAAPHPSRHAPASVRASAHAAVPSRAGTPAAPGSVATTAGSGADPASQPSQPHAQTGGAGTAGGASPATVPDATQAVPDTTQTVPDATQTVSDTTQAATDASAGAVQTVVSGATDVVGTATDAVTATTDAVAGAVGSAPALPAVTVTLPSVPLLP